MSYHPVNVCPCCSSDEPLTRPLPIIASRTGA